MKAGYGMILFELIFIGVVFYFLFNQKEDFDIKNSDKKKSDIKN